MDILFLCTDNYTRSVIAEFCAKNYLRLNHITDITVASAGIRASSDISSYSDLHFQVMRDMDIDVSEFKRTPLGEKSFEEYDFIIGMSELHREFVRKEYNQDIYLFNEVYKSQNTPVNIGAPDEEGFDQKMRELIHYFNNAIPVVIKNIKAYQN